MDQNKSKPTLSTRVLLIVWYISILTTAFAIKFFIAEKIGKYFNQEIDWSWISGYPFNTNQTHWLLAYHPLLVTITLAITSIITIIGIVVIYRRRHY